MTGIEPVFTGDITAVHVTLGSQPGETYIDLGSAPTTLTFTRRLT